MGHLKNLRVEVTFILFSLYYRNEVDSNNDLYR